ncbi:MAG: hypothetical protein ACE5GS_11395 [Kiloniellaceae bacterium]
MRRMVPALGAFALVAACGDSPDDIALARCKEEVRKALESAAPAVTFPKQPAPTLEDDAVYGWHMDIDVDTGERPQSTRRSGYRCLFLVEDRKTPLFLAVLER